MKTVINTLLFLFFCSALSAQVLIDKANKEPELIVRSNVDTIEGDYLTDAGIFRGYLVRKTYRVNYSTTHSHNNLEFGKVIEVLDKDKKRVKDVLGTRELYGIGVHTGTPWRQIYDFNKN